MMTERYCKKCNKMCHCTNAKVKMNAPTVSVMVEKKTLRMKVVAWWLMIPVNVKVANNE